MIWCKNVGISFFCFIATRMFDRRMDGHLAHGYTVAAEFN